MLKQIECSDINYGFWKNSNAFDMRYPGLQGKESFDRVDRTELLMSNKIGSLVFAKNCNRDIRLKRANGRCSISIV